MPWRDLNGEVAEMFGCLPCLDTRELLSAGGFRTFEQQRKTQGARERFNEKRRFQRRLARGGGPPRKSRGTSRPSAEKILVHGLIASGKSNPEISKETGIPLRTIQRWRNHT